MYVHNYVIDLREANKYTAVNYAVKTVEGKAQLKRAKNQIGQSKVIGVHDAHGCQVQIQTTLVSMSKCDYLKEELKQEWCN